jgi:hypothetical protein
VDRTSCNGIYLIEDRIPICPINRNLINGRTSLYYWGPNHALIIILTCIKDDCIKILIKESIDSTSFKFPRV